MASVLDQYAIQTGEPSAIEALTGGLQAGMSLRQQFSKYRQDQQLADLQMQQERMNIQKQELGLRYLPQQLEQEKQLQDLQIQEAQMKLGNLPASLESERAVALDKLLDSTHKLYGGAATVTKAKEVGVLPKEATYTTVREFGLEWDAYELPGVEEPIILDQDKYEKMASYEEQSAIIEKRQKRVADYKKSIATPKKQPEAKPVPSVSIPELTKRQSDSAVLKVNKAVQDLDLDLDMEAAAITAIPLIAATAKEVSELSEDLGAEYVVNYEKALDQIIKDITTSEGVLISNPDTSWFAPKQVVNEQALMERLEAYKKKVLTSNLVVGANKEGRKAYFKVLSDGTKKFVKWIDE